MFAAHLIWVILRVLEAEQDRQRAQRGKPHDEREDVENRMDCSRGMNGSLFTPLYYVQR